MKVCPVCDKTYKDEFLNFCLDDGAGLKEIKTDEPPPTLILDSPRQTNPNYEPQQKDYEKPGFNDYTQPQFGAPNQQIYQQPFAYPQQNQMFVNRDKTMPIISLALGITGITLVCCYLGFPLGIASLIVGYLGMKKADTDPQNYDGRGLAIAGMICGGTAILINIGIVLLAILGQLGS